MKAVIVGAGLAGLAAAHELSKAGWQVKVLESADRVGGRVETVEKNGYRFDSGAVGAGTVYTDYMQLVEELGLSDRIVESSTVSAIYRNGTVHEIDSARPMTGLTTGAFSLGSKLKLAKLAMDVRRIKPDLDIRDVAGAHQYDTESSRAYALRRLNQELADNLIEPLHRTLNLTRADRVSKLELFNALTGLFDTTMITLTGGLATLTDALGKRLDVRTETKVSLIERLDGEIAITCSTAEGEDTLTADACVIATQLPVATEIYPPAKRDLAPLPERLRYNRGIVVTLGYSRPTDTQAMLLMLPVAETQEHALLFLEHNKGPDRAPKGHSLVTVFFDDVALDSSLRKSDAQLIENTARFVEQVLPELRGAMDMSHVRHWGELALTNPDVGLFKLIEGVNRKLDPNDPVQYAGDYFSTAGQNTAIVYGKRAAHNLLAAFG